MENIFEIILVIIFGAIFGSYATLFAYRLPRGESCFGRYFGKKSRCPNCGFTIITRDLIPLLNWIITGGKCRSCKTKIPRIHLFVELLTTIFFVICYLNFGFTEIFIIHCLIAVAMVVIMACDITHKKFTREALTFLLFFVTINRILFDQTLINIVYSLTLGIIFSTIFYKLIHKKINHVFVNEDQFLEYIKFILIASIALDYQSFLYYFFEVMFILLLLSFFKVFGKKNIISIGYVFVFPLLWLLIIQPINY
jgi:prepilin signal peptidase PulO-like enzyme (type II secretory pathway)